MNFPKETSWHRVLKDEFKYPYYLKLQNKVEEAFKQSPDRIFPPKSQIFKAFELCPWEDLRVVILGQDPYPTKGHAHGLCFSVATDVKPLPKSLNNIFKERTSDIDLPYLPDGNLEGWARQGVLLLNNVLTVREGEPDSHKNWGWEQFTDAVIQKIAAEKEHIVYILWGAKAQAKASWIDESRNFILKAVHPSPLSAHRGFFGCRHFSKTNAYLQKLGTQEIQW